MSIVNHSVGKLLVDNVEYVEFERVDKHKPWLGTKIKFRMPLPDSIISHSGINTNTKGNEQEAGQTQANLITNVDFNFKTNSIILDHYRKEAYSIINVRKNHELQELEFFSYRLGLQWIVGYDSFESN